MMSNWGKIKLPETRILFNYSYLEHVKDGHHASDRAPILSLILFFTLKKFNTWIVIDGYNLIYVHNGWESKKKQLRVDDMAQTKKTGI